MDKTFLDRYNQELKYFREASKEFAFENPQVAKRLGLSAPEIEDPYVERLIEAVSFLTARINLKIDSEYPNFVQHIFKVILPEFTQPVPSAGIVAVELSEDKSTLIPKLTTLSTFAQKNGEATCLFSSCQTLQLLPIDIKDVYYSRASRKLEGEHSYKSQLTFNLEFPDSFINEIEEADFDAVRFYIQGNDLRVNSELLYYLHTQSTAMQVELQSDDQVWSEYYEAEVKLSGFDDYLNIYNDRTADYIQHLLEYGVLPEKYLFFQLRNLESVFKNTALLNQLGLQTTDDGTAKKHKLRFIFTFKEISSNLEQFLDKDILSLNSLLINNAFEKRSRIVLDKNVNEQHIVLDNLRPNDYEVLRIEKIEGFSNFNHRVKTYEPLYKLDNDTEHFDSENYGFFSEIHRKNRVLSQATSYKGNECYVMLTNQIKHIQEDNLSQLSVKVWCSNRALPSKINWSLDQDLTINNSAFKISRIKRQLSFTQPLDMPIENTSLWRLMNLVSANFVPLEIENNRALTQQIKNNLFVVYEITKSETFKNQINAIINITAEKASRVKKVNRRLSPINGLKFHITIDELIMSHIHPFLWGHVLLSYLKGFVPLNHYVDLKLFDRKNVLIASYSSM